MTNVEMQTFPTRETWLEARRGSVGGSEAAALAGLHPHLSNVELWEIKTGRKAPKDIGGEPLVVYGTRAEEHLRELFALDYPEMEVGYVPNNLWTQGGLPRMHTSLDGWLTDKDGRFGVWECKTALVQSRQARRKWDGGIPDHYYCQVLWSMGVTGAEFAVLRAYICDPHVTHRAIRDYFIERADVKDDIAALMEAGQDFAAALERDTPPDMILPKI